MLFVWSILPLFALNVVSCQIRLTSFVFALRRTKHKPYFTSFAGDQPIAIGESFSTLAERFSIISSSVMASWLSGADQRFFFFLLSLGLTLDLCESISLTPFHEEIFRWADRPPDLSSSSEGVNASVYKK